MFKKNIPILVLVFSFLFPFVSKATVDLGGVATSTPAVASWSNTRLDVFVRSTNNHLWHRAGVDGNWTAWEDLGGDLLYDPAAVSWGKDRIDIFAVGVDRHMWHLAWTTDGWSKWIDTGGAFQGSPGVASWGENRLDVFAPGLDSHLWHLAWDGKGWSNWTDLGGMIKDGVAAVSWGANRIDVVARATNSHLAQIAWTEQGWSKWIDLGGEITSTPGIVSMKKNRLDVYGRGTDGKLWTRVWNGDTWEDWKSLGLEIPSTPVVIPSNNRIELFTLGPKKQVLIQHLQADDSDATAPVPKIITHGGEKTPASNKDEATAYNLGVSMGIASFQLSVQPEDTNDGSFHTFAPVAQASIMTAAKWAAELKSSVPAIDSDTLSKVDVNNGIATSMATVVNLRGQYAGNLEKVSPRLGQVYALGLDIGIAEGQATGSEAARSIVISSLKHATSMADGLGLDSSQLKTISTNAKKGASMQSIYQQITEIRGKFSSLL